MQQACVRGGELGRSVTNVTPENFRLRPNLVLVPKVNAAYERSIQEEPAENRSRVFRTAHKNFLKEALFLLYVDDRMKEATQWFNYLKTTYTNAFAGKQENISLDDYALGQIVEFYGENDQNTSTASILACSAAAFVASGDGRR